MGRKVFVGNLSYSATEDDLREAFSECGQVTQVKVVTDRETGRSRGFAFVEFSKDSEAREAMGRWDGQSIAGRVVNVNEANDRPPRRREDDHYGR